MTQDDLRDWAAFYLILASEQNPEITEWDDDETIQRKLQRKSELKL